MHSFDKYKELRKKYGMTAAHALRSLKHRAVHDWRVALRNWDFDVSNINRNTTQMHKEVWRHQMEDGNWVSVEASYDTDNDALDGLCEVSHKLPEKYKDQSVVSHDMGQYVVWTGSEYVVVTHNDGCLETAWYRHHGYAKQPALLAAIESRKKQIDWIEDYLQGNVNYVVLEVKIYPPEYGDYDDDADDDEVESLASAGPLGGVEADEDEYLLDTLHELFEEALHDLK